MLEPPSATTPAFVGLGSNLGDRLAHLRAAVDGLARTEGVTLVAVSPVYETAAHTVDADDEQPPYLNAVVHLRTRLAPEALLRRCLALERAAGRRRTRRWASRTLDLDLLVVGERTDNTDRLILPHPRLGERRFVLQPLVDLAPDLLVPAPFGATAAALLDRCPDPDVPRRTDHRLRTHDG